MSAATFPSPRGGRRRKTNEQREAPDPRKSIKLRDAPPGSEQDPHNERVTSKNDGLTEAGMKRTRMLQAGMAKKGAKDNPKSLRKQKAVNRTSF